ncbi:FYN-binding protein 1-like isoform X2 [Lineus longissimus]
MADEHSNVDTESVVSPRDLIKRFNLQNTEMASRGGGPGGLPPKPMLKPSDLKRTQGGLRPVEITPAKKSPNFAAKEDNRRISSTNSDSGNELSRLLEARRKFSEEGETTTNSIAAGLALGLLKFENQRSERNSDANSGSNKSPGVVRPVEMALSKPPVEVTPLKSPVEVTPPKPQTDFHKRRPEPLPKTSLSSGKLLPSPKKDSPPQIQQKCKISPLSPMPPSPMVKQDPNNNLSIEINQRKNDYKFDIITHKGCKYLVYRLPLVVANKPRTPFRASDVVLPSKYSERSTPVTGRISFIKPTESDEEDEDVKPTTPLPPRPIKGFTDHSTADDDDIYDDTDIPQISAPVDMGDEELYEEFNEEELQQIKEKLELEERAKAEKQEKQRQKDEKKNAKEQKRLDKEKKKKQKEEQERQKLKEKEEQEYQRMKDKYKLDGSERVLFSGKAKEKITRNIFETLFEKGDDIPVMRTDESINPKGKWLVQLKDGKFEYTDVRLVETEQPATNGAGDDDENIYEDQDEGFSGSVATTFEEDIYEDL